MTNEVRPLVIPARVPGQAPESFTRMLGQAPPPPPTLPPEPAAALSHGDVVVRDLGMVVAGRGWIAVRTSRKGNGRASGEISMANAFGKRSDVLVSRSGVRQLCRLLGELQALLDAEEKAAPTGAR